MDKRECVWCQTEFSPNRPQQKYCSRDCGYDAKRKPREPWPPPPRTCTVCDQIYLPDSTNQLYCSTACREKLRYQRLRNNPERWSRYLARLRDGYVPRPRAKSERLCTQCDAPHLARGLCRSHYYRARYAEGLDGSSTPTVVLNAVCYRWGASAPKVKQISCLHTVGIIPRCPMCTAGMFPLSGHHFLCRHCWTEAKFNPEEVSWLAASGRHSTSP